MSSDHIIFKQLFERESCTYTYLIADRLSKEAVLIDPVLETFDRDVRILKELELDLKYVINTHCYHDHIASTGLLKKWNTNTKSIISDKSKALADIKINDGDKIKFGQNNNIVIECIYTPGHTFGCFSFVCREIKSVFTGDALLIRGCGRTDFEKSDASLLFESIHDKIFTLPDDYTVFPGHDYNGMTSSTISEEKMLNPRLTLSKQDFINLMKNLNLALPKKFNIAVATNMVCGMQG